ncbi:hypothetical protein NC661_05620 [Aquibacillus koreensis]|uniref:Uncharacterized protein n=1 Tax=Aquibacillus koreensis TaxID=279446 RepID=A0A9X4AIW9_9BACI|nr:hypothetical protein [Aquibacillus koreensis]MCT2534661.1 hypothetical protein [Aquibacillus koreensis]MDC3419845.1 hypothetical protein [Aquibacillus koreensis]
MKDIKIHVVDNNETGSIGVAIPTTISNRGLIESIKNETLRTQLEIQFYETLKQWAKDNHIDIE